MSFKFFIRETANSPSWPNSQLCGAVVFTLLFNMIHLATFVFVAVNLIVISVSQSMT